MTGSNLSPEVKLDTCPFCGGDPVIHDIEPHKHFLVNLPDHNGSTVIECGCGAGLIDESRARVIERWNKREYRTQIDNLHSVMIAAAEEIHEHWPAHCDAEGYGPANLMTRLEAGIPSEYAYKAGDFERQRLEIKTLKEKLAALEQPQPETAGALSDIDRNKLRNFVDDIWNEATESQTVPSYNWADEIIDRHFPARPSPPPKALLEVAWRKYGRHLHDCQRYGQNQCTCGFVETCVALRKSAEPGDSNGE